MSGFRFVTATMCSEKRMSLTAPIIALVIALGALVAMTTFGVARIEAAHPPAGQFVEVEGVRLHVAETRACA